MTAGLDHVLRPGRIGRLAVPHRVVMGAMHLGWEARDDGGRALAEFYLERVRGGTGLMVTGGAAVNPPGVGGPGYGVLDDTEFRARLARVASDLRAASGLLALQLFHAGRYAKPEPGGPSPVAPSAVFSRFSGCVPEELSADEVQRTVADFARGASQARELGFAAVEIMGSEGYLIDQFLSPLTNQRVDDWGGDRERRMRFGVAVVAAVRAAVGPDFPVVMRMTGADLMEGGVDQDTVLAFARALADAGADALNIGVGWHESAVPTVQALVPAGHWVPVAAAIKRAVGGVPVMASNRINTLIQAEAVLADTGLDFVSMARPFLADPALVDSGRRGRAVNICVACNQACIDRSLVDEPVSCMVNPRVGRERWPRPSAAARHLGAVAVVGAGPAGLKCAHELALAGHRVDVYDRNKDPGGQFRLACKVPGKADFAAAVDYLTSELTRLGAVIHPGRAVTEADAELLAGYDGVVIATGVTPRCAPIPGADRSNVLDYVSAFDDGALGPRVVIIGGGGVAVDLAHLASHDTAAARQVTIVHRGDRLAPRLGRSTRWAVLAALRDRQVSVLPGASDLHIDDVGVRLVDADGRARRLPADTVVLATGQLPDRELVQTVRRTGVWHRVVGGARSTEGLDAVRAFAEGYAAAAAFHRVHQRIRPTSPSASHPED
jgi:2,4-dienoyl-CoA reductase (NADPH2)